MSEGVTWIETFESFETFETFETFESFESFESFAFHVLQNVSNDPNGSNGSNDPNGSNGSNGPNDRTVVLLESAAATQRDWNESLSLRNHGPSRLGRHGRRVSGRGYEARS